MAALLQVPPEQEPSLGDSLGARPGILCAALGRAIETADPARLCFDGYPDSRPRVRVERAPRDATAPRWPEERERAGYLPAPSCSTVGIAL